MASQKIVHLHLKVPIDTKQDFYFGSIKAIYDFTTEDVVGIRYKSLTNALRNRERYENKHCIIITSTLITKQHTNKRQTQQ